MGLVLVGLLRQQLHMRSRSASLLRLLLLHPGTNNDLALGIIKQKSDTGMPVLVFATTYSRQLLNNGLSRAIFSYQHLLCSRRVSCNSFKLMTAWRTGFKPRKSLIAFQFSKPVRRRDSSSKSGTGTPGGTSGDSLPHAPNICLDETTTVSLAAGSNNTRAYGETTTPNSSYYMRYMWGRNRPVVLVATKKYSGVVSSRTVV